MSKKHCITEYIQELQHALFAFYKTPCRANKIRVYNILRQSSNTQIPYHTKKGEKGKANFFLDDDIRKLRRSFALLPKKEVFRAYNKLIRHLQIFIDQIGGPNLALEKIYM